MEIILESFLNNEVGSLVMAAGKGSRMKGFEGNKTLLPLVPGPTPFEGERPILLHILCNLPPGPKALVVNHRKQDVIESTRDMEMLYYEQPVLNGTGGALLAARAFIESEPIDKIIITMGDVPFVLNITYMHLINRLKDYALVVLGFRPRDKKQYGALEIEGDLVKKIVEWKYWSAFPEEEQAQLGICNSGIYAARRKELTRYLGRLENMPHRIEKEREGRTVEIEEFFITDLVELMRTDGLKVGYVVAENEKEVMGLDDLQSLRAAQEYFKELENPGTEEPVCQAKINGLSGVVPL